MLFRNSLRLIFTRKSCDCIQIGFLAGGKELFAARLAGESDVVSGKGHELRAEVGPFSEVSWTFNGKEIDVDALVRHYLREFIIHSAR